MTADKLKLNTNTKLPLPRRTLEPKPALALVLLALALTATSRLAPVETLCPSPADIRPCTCDDEGLQCPRLNDSGLARVFQAPAERKAIRRVWIFQTNLTRLPNKAFGDYIIRDLYLDLNQISRVESGAFGEASKTLQSLSFTRNRLVEFPFEDLGQMRKLRQLGFGYNQLKTIKAAAFPASDTLESLDLSHNHIESIEANAFESLHEVSLIDLSRNNLVSVEANALRVRSTYRHLAISLRGNQINKIASDAFGSHHPHSLDLSRNKLTYLDQLTFEPLLVNETAIYVEGKCGGARLLLADVALAPGARQLSRELPSDLARPTRSQTDNPFSCSGCELYRWLLELEPASLANLINFSCADETKLEDLTLEMIGCTGETN